MSLKDEKCSSFTNLEHVQSVTEKVFNKKENLFIDGHLILPSFNSNVTLNLDSDNIDKYTPLTIKLNGELITLDHEDIKDLFYREKERKINKLIDFMRDNDFKEKDISGVISNLRSDTNEP